MIATPTAISDPVRKSTRLRPRVRIHDEDERLAGEQRGRRGAGPGGDERSEDPVPQRSPVLGRGLGEEQRRRDRRAEHRPDRAGERETGPGPHGDHGEEPQADQDGEAEVEPDDRVLGSQAHAAGERHHQGEGEPGQDEQRLRRLDQAGGGRVGAGVAGDEGEDQPRREPGRREHAEDPDRLGAREPHRHGEPIPQDLFDDPCEARQGDQGHAGAGAHEDRRQDDREQRPRAIAGRGRRRQRGCLDARRVLDRRALVRHAAIVRRRRAPRPVRPTLAA